MDCLFTGNFVVPGFEYEALLPTDSIHFSQGEVYYQVPLVECTGYTEDGGADNMGCTSSAPPPPQQGDSNLPPLDASARYRVALQAADPVAGDLSLRTLPPPENERARLANLDEALAQGPRKKPKAVSGLRAYVRTQSALKAGRKRDFTANLVRERSLQEFYFEYEIVADVDLLGRGVTGVVRRVMHKESKAQYACKSMNLAKFDRAQKEELKNELQVLRHLQHPNVVRLWEVFGGRREVLLVMELLTGESLWNRQPQGEESIARVLHQICSATHYLHKRGIAHRDIKPDNIMYSTPAPDSPVILIDFGFSKTFARIRARNGPRPGQAHGQGLRGTDSSPSTSAILARTADTTFVDEVLETAVGNAWFQAPEVFAGAHYSESCDMWSIGVISFWLVTGHLPFDVERPRLGLDSKGKEIRARPDTDPGIADAVVALSSKGAADFTADAWTPLSRRFVRGLLRVNPRDRLSSTVAVSHKWFQVTLDSLDEGQADHDLRQSETKTNNEDTDTSGGPAERVALDLPPSSAATVPAAGTGADPGAGSLETQGAPNIGQSAGVSANAAPGTESAAEASNLPHADGAERHAENGAPAQLSSQSTEDDPDLGHGAIHLHHGYPTDDDPDTEGYDSEAGGFESGTPLLRWNSVSSAVSGRHSTGAPRVARRRKLEHEFEKLVVQSLWSYARFPALKRAALVAVAFLLPSSAVPLAELRAAFEAIDEASEGEITVEELEKVLARHGMNDQESVRMLFDSLDVDRTGKVHYTEFIAATMQMRCELTTEAYRRAFQLLDTDSSGEISLTNLCTLLGTFLPLCLAHRASLVSSQLRAVAISPAQSPALLTGKSYTRAEVEAMIQDADLEKDGVISEREFMDLMSSDLVAPRAT